MNTGDHDEAFERRSRELLRDSVGQLDGATRSRLAQARAAALAGPAPRRSWLDLRHLAPAGAMAAVALATVLFIAHEPGGESVNGGGGAALYDLELLADADAWELAQEPDLEFIEWAAAMGEPATGT